MEPSCNNQEQLDELTGNYRNQAPAVIRDIICSLFVHGQYNLVLPLVNTCMRLEVESAANFLAHLCRCSQDYTFSEKKLSKFIHHAVEILKCQYREHWFPEEPFKSSGYRCLRHNRQGLDARLVQAAKLSKLNPERIHKSLPSEVTVWVDPLEVSYRIGENGTICILYEFREGALNMPWTPDHYTLGSKRHSLLWYWEHLFKKSAGLRHHGVGDNNNNGQRLDVRLLQEFQKEMGYDKLGRNKPSLQRFQVPMTNPKMPIYREASMNFTTRLQSTTWALGQKLSLINSKLIAFLKKAFQVL